MTGVDWAETAAVLRGTAGALLLIVCWFLIDVTEEWMIARWRLRRWRKMAVRTGALLAAFATALVANLVGDTAAVIAGLTVWFVLAGIQFVRTRRTLRKAKR